MNKTVIITGASNGLGYETAKLFASNGWNVLGTSTTDEGKRKIEEIGTNCKAVVANFENHTDIDEICRVFEENFSQIDVLINNVGTKSKGTIEAIEPTEIQRVLQINIAAHILITQKVVSRMKKQNSGRIINISSTLGIEASENFSLYAASKFALSGFSKSLMHELLEYNIPVSTVYPGGMATDFHDKPRPDYLEAQQVAETIYFIATRPKELIISEMTVISKVEKKIP